MDEIDLPFLPGDTGLERAIEVLRSSGKHGLVTEQLGDYVVLRAVDVFECWNALDDGKDPGAAMDRQKKAQLRQVVPRATRAVQPARVAGLESVLQVPEQRATMEDIFREHLRENDKRHAVREVLGDKATVVTASERFMYTLRDGRDDIPGAAPSFLECKGNPVHYWESFELNDPALCNKPHRARIVGR
jgi:hypothetical protein